MAVKVGPLYLLHGATAWEAQLGPIWVGLNYPRFWLYGRTPGYGRTWLFSWPGFVRKASIGDTA